MLLPILYVLVYSVFGAYFRQEELLDIQPLTLAVDKVSR